MPESGGSMVRCVNGDVPAGDLGACYAHEHVFVTGGALASADPEFLLEDRDAAVSELVLARDAGLAALVDATPCAFGRDVVALAEVSRATGVHVVAATGLHLPSSYVRRHWLSEYATEELEELFVADIELGIDRHDYVGPIVHRTPHRAGVIKVAVAADQVSDVEARVLRAAAGAARRTGAAIIAHTNGAVGGAAVAELLLQAGLEPDRVILSHLDKDAEPDGTRNVLALGVWAELDQAPRAADRTERFVLALLEAGYEDKVLLGMDMGRRRYWRAYGGGPGLDFLLTAFRSSLVAAGVTATQLAKLFVDNPWRAFAMRAAA